METKGVKFEALDRIFILNIEEIATTKEEIYVEFCIECPALSDCTITQQHDFGCFRYYCDLQNGDAPSYPDLLHQTTGLNEENIKEIYGNEAMEIFWKKLGHSEQLLCQKFGYKFE